MLFSLWQEAEIAIQSGKARVALSHELGSPAIVCIFRTQKVVSFL